MSASVRSATVFGSLKPQPADALLALIGLFRDDQRPAKIDLGVGTYRDDGGGTPIMEAIKSAERQLADRQQTKAYLGPEGDPRFVELLVPIAFGAADAHNRRLVGVQTPGGSGALRLGGELIAAARPGAKVWLGTPTWPNHRPVLEAAGLTVNEYASFDVATQSLRFDEMLTALSAAEAGDVVLLHGCCHNPTGAELDEAQWEQVAELLAERRLLPFIDLAYQGLGAGLDADALGTRIVLSRVEEALVAYSCDKNFSLYRDRTGALFVLARDDVSAEVVHGHLLTLARVNWSMPPDHGAAAVRAVLESQELTHTWRIELEVMCQRIGAVRHALVAADPRLAFLSGQRGMFSLLPIAPAAVAALRRDHAIYMAGNGRVNLAGLRIADVGTFVHALSAVGALPSAGTSAT